MIRKILGVLLVALAFLAGAVLVPRAAQSSDTATVTRGCVIRFDGGPKIYDKTNHACSAVEDVSVDSAGDLVLDLVAVPTGTKILYMSAEEDETLSRYVQCGPSGGIGTTIVRCYSRSGVHVHVTGPLMNRPYANLWMGWVYEVPA